jgi:hypothetical protein
VGLAACEAPGARGPLPGSPASRASVVCNLCKSLGDGGSEALGCGRYDFT